MSDRKMEELHGSKPGPACPAYHKHKNREHCQETKCRYYHNHRVSPINQGGVSKANMGGSVSNANMAGDVNESLDALSIKTPTVGFGGKEFFEIHEECKWHCVRYDLPSKYMTLPWE